ncbi:MAG: RagB/SusD family nutrient uptake outer membrane protein [Porphyromonas sp.]|nr:RagB/SusD family nutrient uptake outer membrane protein [Porphyromonas sp.]
MNKYINNILLRIAWVALLVVPAMTSCNYLDIVPDETATEKDAFANPEAVKAYLYSAYGYIPAPHDAVNSIDFMTGDEIVSSFEHEKFANFPKGSYTAVNPQISYWNSLFGGLRRCYILIEKIDEVPKLDAKVAADYKSQAKFLIGYFTYLLIQNYGPTIIIDGVEDVNMPSEDYKKRATLKESVEFAKKMLDEAAAELPATRQGAQYGFATSVAAKAIKAKLLVLYASPIFNGNKMYSNFTDKEGVQLIPTEYEQARWTEALQACQDAVRAAEAAGHRLYQDKDNNIESMPEPSDKVQRSLRMSTLDSASSTETVWGDTRVQGWYAVMPKSLPLYDKEAAWNGVAPTLAMMKRFYTANGLPMEEDPTFPTEGEWWTLKEMASDYPNAKGRIPNFLYNREPRLYAWVCFQNGYYEVKQGNKENSGTMYDDKYYNEGKTKLVLKMMIGEPAGRGKSISTLRNNNYSPTGFLNKRLVHPNIDYSKYRIKYIHPYVTLADLYLLTAESAVETGDLTTAKNYLDKIRKRAGIPSVDEAWAGARNPQKAQSKEGMRDIVRQERSIEMYLLNQNFWDRRRWLDAEKYFSAVPQGMNVNTGTTLELYTQVTNVDVVRRFESPKNYLMPIPQSDINKNQKLVQNPGY